MSDHSWIESIQDKLHQLERLDVWELVLRPDGKNIGYKPEEGIDFEESFAPVARLESVEESSIWFQTSSTSMATERLDDDLQGTPTDQTTYRQMIKGLMYLTASHPDITFATFVRARYQAHPTDRLTSRDKSLDLFAFKLSRIFFTLLSSGSSSCWRSYAAQRGGNENHRGSSNNNNNYSSSNNRNSGNGRDQRNRGHQSNRSTNFEKDCRKNTTTSTSGQDDKKPAGGLFPPESLSPSGPSGRGIVLAVPSLEAVEGNPLSVGRTFPPKSLGSVVIPSCKDTQGNQGNSTPKPTEHFKQSHSVSSGTVPDPQDLERNIQLASTGLPSTLDEGTCKSQPLYEGITTDPKDLGGNVLPTDKGLPSTASHEGTAKTKPRPEGPLGDKDSGGNQPPADMEPINPTVIDPSGTGAKYQKKEVEALSPSGCLQQSYWPPI
nr:retrovirus-related Pol polyprotein from transposon TNT 1-94 [Tanacetum cinerariifolium]